MLLCKEPHTMDVLSPIPHSFFVHGQGQTILKYNQYTRNMSIQATEHQSYGTRCCENCKSMMLSLGWSVLLHTESHAMDMLPPIPNILWVHGQGLKSHGQSQYTMTLIITSCRTRIGGNCKTTKPSSGLSMLLSEEPEVIDVLSSIVYVS